MYYFKIIHTKRTDRNPMQQTQSAQSVSRTKVGRIARRPHALIMNYSHVQQLMLLQKDVSVFFWLTVIYFFI